MSENISVCAGGLTAEEKWNELKRHILESIKWYREQQNNPKADIFYFFSRECCESDIISYMMYLDGKDNPDTMVLLGLLGKPAAYTIPPRARSTPRGERMITVNPREDDTSICPQCGKNRTNFTSEYAFCKECNVRWKINWGLFLNRCDTR